MLNRFNKIIVLVKEKKMIGVENTSGQGKDDIAVVECDISNVKSISEDERFKELFKDFFKVHSDLLKRIGAGKIGNEVMTVCWEGNNKLSDYYSVFYDGDRTKEGFWSNGYYRYGQYTYGWLFLH